MFLGTYRLQDPNGHELAALVHGNRLIKANIRTADEPRDLWASPKAKDKLRRRNHNLELLPSYATNMDILDQYLQHNAGDDLDEMPDLEMSDIMPRCHLKRKHDPDVFDEIVIQKAPRLSK